MKRVLEIKGMHCNACKTLIEMEIDDLGFADKIQSLDIFQDKNIGTLSLINLENDDQLNQIITSINQMENYKISQ